MTDEQYPSNSHKSKQQSEKPVKPKAQSVVSGTVITKKKTLGDKLKSTFVAEDVKTVGHYIFTDTIVPKFKDALVSIVTNGVNMLMYGTSAKPASSDSRHAGPIGSKVSYRSYYSNPRGSVPVRTTPNAYDFDSVIFDSRGDAELVLDQLTDMISSYGVATVADYYDSCGVTSDYTTVDYGWKTLANAYVERSDGGYVIRFPRAVPLR